MTNLGSVSTSSRSPMDEKSVPKLNEESSVTSSNSNGVISISSRSVSSAPNPASAALNVTNATPQAAAMRQPTQTSEFFLIKGFKPFKNPFFIGPSNQESRKRPANQVTQEQTSEARLPKRQKTTIPVTMNPTSPLSDNYVRNQPKTLGDNSELIANLIRMKKLSPSEISKTLLKIPWSERYKILHMTRVNKLNDIMAKNKSNQMVLDYCLEHFFDLVKKTDLNKASFTRWKIVTSIIDKPQINQDKLNFITNKKIVAFMFSNNTYNDRFDRIELINETIQRIDQGPQLPSAILQLVDKWIAPTPKEVVRLIQTLINNNIPTQTFNGEHSGIQNAMNILKKIDLDLFKKIKASFCTIKYTYAPRDYFHHIMRLCSSKNLRSKVGLVIDYLNQGNPKRPDLIAVNDVKSLFDISHKYFENRVDTCFLQINQAKHVFASYHDYSNESVTHCLDIPDPQEPLDYEEQKKDTFSLTSFSGIGSFETMTTPLDSDNESAKMPERNAETAQYDDQQDERPKLNICIEQVNKKARIENPMTDPQHSPLAQLKKTMEELQEIKGNSPHTFQSEAENRLIELNKKTKAFAKFARHDHYASLQFGPDKPAEETSTQNDS